MRFSISGDHLLEATNLHEYVERRLCFALGRFATAIDRVRVRVTDANGPHGGSDKHCQIVVKLRASGSKSITVEDTDPELRAALTRACNRAGRCVARAIERRRSQKSYQRRRFPINLESPVCAEVST